MTSSNHAIMDITFIGEQLLRPPMIELIFKVMLHNPAAKPRWFLLPERINPALQHREQSSYGVEVGQLKGRGRGIFNRFQGKFASQGFLLPAEAHFTLDDLKIVLWSEEPARTVDIPLVIADDILIEGQPVAAWVKAEMMSDAQVSATGELISLHTRTSVNFEELPLTLVGQETVVFSVELS